MADNQSMQKSTSKREENPHIIMRWLDWLQHGEFPEQIPIEELERAISHISDCIECQIQLVPLHDLVTSPAIESLMAHTQPDQQIPDEFDLADYAALVVESDVATADQIYPGVAIHLSNCQRCRVIIQDTLEMMDATKAIAFAAAYTKLPLIEPVPVSIWRQVGEQTRRLAEPLMVWVRRRSLRITSALDELAITLHPVNPEGVVLSGSLAPDSNTAATLVVDLRDETTGSKPWLQIRLKWESSYVRRALVTFQIAWTTTVGDEIKPAQNISWWFNATSTPLPYEAIKSGVTGETGEGAFHVSKPGEYLLTFREGESDWVAPFDLRWENKKD